MLTPPDVGRDEQAAARLGRHFGLEGIVVHAKCGLNLRLRGAIELVITDLQMWKEIQDDIEREPLAQTDQQVDFMDIKFDEEFWTKVI